jgi:hypothetical protein
MMMELNVVLRKVVVGSCLGDARREDQDIMGDAEL